MSKVYHFSVDENPLNTWAAYGSHRVEDCTMVNFYQGDASRVAVFFNDEETGRPDCIKLYKDPTLGGGNWDRGSLMDDSEEHIEIFYLWASMVIGDE